MLRAPNPTGRSRYVPMLQWLPRPLNYYIQPYELTLAEKLVRAPVSATAWILRRVLMVTITLGIPSCIIPAVAYYTGNWSLERLVAWVVVVAAAWILMFVLEGLSALVRGRAFRGDGDTSSSPVPTPIQVVVTAGE